MKQNNFLKGYYALSFLFDCMDTKNVYPRKRLEILKELTKLASFFISDAKVDKVKNTYLKSIRNTTGIIELTDKEFNYLLSDISALAKVYLQTLPMLKEFTLLDDIILSGYESVSDEEKENINAITDNFKNNLEKYA